MNIFAVSPIPSQCAEALDDRRLNKMILETAQLLSTAVRKVCILIPEGPEKGLYKLTHVNHPCSQWVRANAQQFEWTIKLGFCLSNEWLFRRGTLHASSAVISVASGFGFNFQFADAPGKAFPYWPFPDCSNVGDFPGTIHERYQECLRRKWMADTEAGRPPKWTKRGKPWFL